MTKPCRNIFVQFLEMDIFRVQYWGYLNLRHSIGDNYGSYRSFESNGEI